MYSGTTTSDIPAPIPERKRPRIIMDKWPAKASRLEPRILASAATLITNNLPRLPETGPADKAPRKPPSVNIEETKANSDLDMWMQLGRDELNELLATDFVLQVIAA
jgi:hypothetical protein